MAGEWGILRQIFVHFDIKTLLRLRLVNKTWKSVIEAHPAFWRRLWLALRVNYMLIDPLWMKLDAILLQKPKYLPKVVESMIRYEREMRKNPIYPELTARTHHTFMALYCDYTRLAEMWYFIKYGPHPKRILNFQIKYGYNRCFLFLLKNYPGINEWLKDGEDEGLTIKPFIFLLTAIILHFCKEIAIFEVS